MKKKALISYYIIFVIIFSISPGVSATNYYVSSSGNDAANGLTPATAWATITKVNATAFFPGDSIFFKRGDTWANAELLISHSGTVGSHIYYGAYGTGAKPIFTGKRYIGGWDTPGNWTDNGSNNWSIVTDQTPRLWINGVEALKSETSSVTAIHPWFFGSGNLYVYSTTNPATAFTNIEGTYNTNCINTVDNSSNYITIQYLDLRGANYMIQLNGVTDWLIDSCNIGLDAGGRGINSSAAGTVLMSNNNIIVSNNMFDSNDHNIDEYSYNNTYEAISIWNGVSGWDIYNNTFKDWSHAAFNIRSVDLGYHVTHMKFHDNICSGSNIDYGRGFGIEIKDDPGGSYDNEMYNNFFYDFGVLNEFTGIGDGFKFYNNVIDGVRFTDYPPFNYISYATGIYIQALFGNVSNLEMYNNVIMNCAGDGLGIWYSGSHLIQHNLIKNNIFYNNGTHQMRWDDSPGVLLDNTYENNIFYKSGQNTPIYNGKMEYVPEQSVATFNSMDGSTDGMFLGEVADNIKNNIQEDPLFVDATNPNYLLRDYHLKAGSPAFGAGVNVGLLTDHDGYAWLDLDHPNIGAFSSGKIKPPPPFHKPEIKISPNPAQDFVEISMEEPSLVPYLIRIISLSGKIFFEYLLEADSQNITIPINFISGFYIVQILSGNFIVDAQSLVVAK